MIKKLKYILNSLSEEELEKMDIWVDSRYEIDSIWVEDFHINLITDEAEVKINNEVDKEGNYVKNKR